MHLHGSVYGDYEKDFVLAAREYESGVTSEVGARAFLARLAQKRRWVCWLPAGDNAIRLLLHVTMISFVKQS